MCGPSFCCSVDSRWRLKPLTAMAEATRLEEPTKGQPQFENARSRLASFGLPSSPGGDAPVAVTLTAAGKGAAFAAAGALPHGKRCGGQGGDPNAQEWARRPRGLALGRRLLLFCENAPA